MTHETVRHRPGSPALAVLCSPAPCSTAQTRTALGTPLAGHHAGRVRGVPPRAGRLPRSRSQRRRAWDPRSTARAAPSATTFPTIGGAGTMAELRAGRRNANGEFETLDASGDTLFHMFSVPGHGCQPVLPPDTNVFARRVPIPLFGAGLVEAIPDDTLLRARRSRTIATATASAAAPRSSSMSKPASAASDGSAGRRSTPRSSRSAPTPIATRWESPTTCSRTKARSASPPDRMRLCDPFSGSRRHPRSPLAPARHRQLRELHALPGAGGARGT